MILCCGEALIDFLPVKTEAGDIAFQPFNGGSVYNVAIALGRLGIDVGFFGGVSEDLFGRSLAEGLKASKVDLSFAVRSDRSSTLAFVKFNEGDAEYAFVDDGSAGRMLAESDIPDFPESVNALHFGSISLIPDPGGATFETMAVRNAKTRLISFDPNIRPGLIDDRAAYLRRFETLVGCADILKLSDADLNWLAPEADPRALAREWIGRGVGLVIVTRGNEGAIAYTAGEVVASKPLQVRVADTIGAGDTFMAGMLAHLENAGILTPDSVAGMDRNSVMAALDFATRAAAITVSRPGADPPWADELNNQTNNG
ncbi:MAG: carbohydrate kinase [Rhodospirillales bacterium]|nr:carbohydrate kinase [Rhodospirillales bacterium]